MYESQKRYSKNNPEKVKKWKKDWSESHKDQLREYNKTWKSNNRDKIRQSRQKYNLKKLIKKLEDPYFARRYEQKFIEKSIFIKHYRKYRTGSFSLQTRFLVLKRDNFACQYCGKRAPDIVLHVDHKIAYAKGGKNTLDNLITACAECNIGKGDL